MLSAFLSVDLYFQEMKIMKIFIYSLLQFIFALSF